MPSQPTDQQSGEEQGAPTFSEFRYPATTSGAKRRRRPSRCVVREETDHTTHEGIDLQPMYRAEDTAEVPHMGTMPGFAPYVRGTETLGYKATRGKSARSCPTLPASVQ